MLLNDKEVKAQADKHSRNRLQWYVYNNHYLIPTSPLAMGPTFGCPWPINIISTRGDVKHLNLAHNNAPLKFHILQHTIIPHRHSSSSNNVQNPTQLLSQIRIHSIQCPFSGSLWFDLSLWLMIDVLTNKKHMVK